MQSWKLVFRESWKTVIGKVLVDQKMWLQSALIAPEGLGGKAMQEGVLEARTTRRLLRGPWE